LETKPDTKLSGLKTSVNYFLEKFVISGGGTDAAVFHSPKNFGVLLHVTFRLFCELLNSLSLHKKCQETVSIKIQIGAVSGADIPCADKKRGL
jgi:hypothetical protein